MPQYVKTVLLFQCVYLLSLGCYCVSAANITVATFNETHVASIKTSEPFNVDFELRTSHPAWGIWSLQAVNAAVTDEPLIRLGLSENNLTVSQPNGSTVIAANLTDGNWHSIRILMDSNRTEFIVVIDTVKTTILLPTNLTSANFSMTFGGVNGTGGLRGCLANASLNNSFSPVDLTWNSISVISRATPNCIEDPCPCANNGRCIPRAKWNLHSGCDCNGTGFQGLYCERDHCEPNSTEKCSGHGRCISIPSRSTFYCNCTGTSWLGKYCQSRDPCQPNPCGDMGNCSLVAENFTHSCTCAPGYGGLNCTETPLTMQSPSDTRIVVGLVVGLLLLLLVGTALGLFGQHLRNRRKDTGVYKPSDRELGGANGVHSLRDFLHPPTEERLV